MTGKVLMSKNEKGDEGEVEGKRVAGQCVNMTKVQEMCLKKDSPTPDQRKWR